LRNTPPQHTTTDRISFAFTQTESGIWTVHQQEPLCVLDGNGLRSRTRHHSRRRRQKRPTDDLCGGVVADLDRARAREFAWRRARDDRADPRRRASVDERSEDHTVVRAQSSVTRYIGYRHWVGNDLGRRRSTGDEL